MKNPSPKAAVLALAALMAFLAPLAASAQAFWSVTVGLE